MYIPSNPHRKVAAIALMICFFLLLSMAGYSQDVAETEAKLLKEAEENIVKYRKGEVLITFKGQDGKALQNARIEVKQEGHDFLFGCIIFDLTRNDKPYREELFKQGPGMKEHRECLVGKKCYLRLNGVSSMALLPKDILWSGPAVPALHNGSENIHLKRQRNY
jgi:hypothetical protein